MKNRWLALLLVAVLTLTPCALAEEDIGFTGETESASEQAHDWRALLPTLQDDGVLSEKLGENKKITILTHYTFKGDVTDGFQQLYGGEVEEILCSVDEYSSKLSNMIAAGNPPDLVVCQSAMQPSLVVLANAGLVQPFDPYLDYSVPELSALKHTYDAGVWNGLHYLAPYCEEPIYIMVYNPVIFEEAGIENPWALYQKGEWDWNAYRRVTETLNQFNQDGSINTLGTTIPGFAALASASGIDFVEMKDGAYQVNLKDASLTSAMNFLNDMVYRDNVVKVKAQGAWSAYFRRGTLAMQIIDYWQVKGQAEIAAAAKKGRRGIAPLPQNPAHNNIPEAYSVYSMSSGFCLSKGAKNPEGAALFIRYLSYINNYSNDELGIGISFGLARMLENGFTDEHLVQYLTASDVSNSVISFGYGFMSDAGGWDFLGDQNNWTSYVESILPGIEEKVRELTAK